MGLIYHMKTWSSAIDLKSNLSWLRWGIIWCLVNMIHVMLSPLVNIMSLFWLIWKDQSLREFSNFDFLLNDFWWCVNELVNEAGHSEDSSNNSTQPSCKVTKRPFLFAILHHYWGKLVVKKDPRHAGFPRHDRYSLGVTSDRKLTRLKNWPVQPEKRGHL